MIRRTFLFLSIVIGLLACSDNDTFTTSPNALLSFSKDTVNMDTIFSNYGSRTHDFWVFNNTSDGLRIQSVRLKRGNQTGYRVNVDGIYLDNNYGSVLTDIEVRKNDSIRVKLESGVEQVVSLHAFAWDAIELRDMVVKSDSVIESQRPIVVYGGITVDSAVTLTIKNSTLYFHDGKGVDVYGCLMMDSVVLRGDRLDHMFDYLPYDRVSGQWGNKGGIRIHSSSKGNKFRRTEIRNAGELGLRCDSASFDADVLRLDIE